MRKVELKMKEKEKYDVIKELVDHNGNKNRACKKLGISKRQVNRLIIKYKEKGKAGFVHGNRTRKPINALDKSISEDIILLYKSKYQDWNFNHFKEFLKKNENIDVSYDFIYRTLTKEGILSPKARKKTKHEYAKQKLLQEKKINLAMSDEQIETIVSHEVALENAHPRGEKPKYFGEVIEQDGSIHIWFGGVKTCLHLAIDKATSTIVGAWFDKQETLNGYYNITKQILMKYGIPYKFKTDKRTVFEYKRKGSSLLEEDTFTQFAYACSQLGIQLETSSVPEFKPRIERVFQTLQQRLPQELRLAGISTIEQANEFLKQYINKFNKQFALCIDNNKSVFEKQPDEQKIDLILAVLTKRIIDKGHSISYNNKYYRLVNRINTPIYFNRGTTCVVIKSFNNRLYATVNDTVFALEEIPKVQALSENFDEIIEAKPKRVYIPMMKHPWRQQILDNFIEKQHHLQNVS